MRGRCRVGGVVYIENEDRLCQIPCSALVLRLRHLRDLGLWALFRRSDGDHGLNLLFAFAMSFLYEMPERVDEDVVGCRPTVPQTSANITDPTYRRPILGREADRRSDSVIRDVFLSRAHGQNSTLTALSHWSIIT